MNFTLRRDELLSNSDRQLAFSGAKVNGIAAPLSMKRARVGKGERGQKGYEGYGKRAVYGDANHHL